MLLKVKTFCKGAHSQKCKIFVNRTSLEQVNELVYWEVCYVEMENTKWMWKVVFLLVTE